MSAGAGALGASAIAGRSVGRPPRRPEAPAPGNGLNLLDADFARIAAMLHADSGIRLHESKSSLVFSRLVRRVSELGLSSFSEYCDLVARPDGTGERQAMMAALTTNVTRFFREPHHFEHLRTQVLPAAAQRARAGGCVRLWSAACSTGQEPFSIALTLLSVLPEAPQLDVRILATDIDPNVLEQARTATYPENLIDDIPRNLRGRWVQPMPDKQWIMAEPVRKLVAFRELNLTRSWPLKQRFDAIFCRNVAIYFDEPTQRALWDRFEPRLSEDGFLYIGHAEHIASSAFETVGQTTYRLGRRP